MLHFVFEKDDSRAFFTWNGGTKHPQITQDQKFCPSQAKLTHIFGVGGGGIRLIVGFQPLMVISQTASWIRWCMQVNAWWFNVDLSCLGRTIYARQFLGAKPPIQVRHRWAERNHPDHLYWPRPAQSDPQLIKAKRQAEKSKPPIFYVYGVMRTWIEPQPPAPRADALTIRLRGGGHLWRRTNAVNKMYFLIFHDIRQNHISSWSWKT